MYVMNKIAKWKGVIKLEKVHYSFDDELSSEFDNFSIRVSQALAGNGGCFTARRIALNLDSKMFMLSFECRSEKSLEFIQGEIFEFLKIYFLNKGITVDRDGFRVEAYISAEYLAQQLRERRQKTAAGR